MINELSIHNYKSIRKVALNRLPSLAVFVGANSAGKSNFADALDFLSLVFREGLSGAVRAKGGYENICFRRAKRSKAGLTFHIKATATRDIDDSITKKKDTYIFFYDFTFSTTTQSIVSEYEVISEKIRVLSKSASSTRELFSINRYKNDIEVKGADSMKRHEFWLVPVDYVKDCVTRPAAVQDELILTSRLKHYPPFIWLTQLLGNCGVYQISPFIARGTGIPERSAELGKHGENLPAAVNYLERFQSESFKELLNHVSNTVPTIKGLETDYVETKQLGLFFKEIDVGRRWFSEDVSDGTIQTVCIFFPLVDPRKEILFIEEPENSLHPWILRHFMDSCKQHSKDKQIFITTQSIVAVNEIPIESLYIVTRTRGETHISRCIDINPELQQVILEQLMGIGECWDSGAISGVPFYGGQLRFFEEKP